MRSQFWGLYSREVVRTFRNPLVLGLTLVQPFMWLAFFGSAWEQIASKNLGVFGTTNYIAFLLPGVLSTSMLSVGMFGAMSTIQDKRFGFMKRILITPTTKGVIFLSKSLGSATRGLVQIPVMLVAAAAWGVPLGHIPPLDWAAWGVMLFFMAMGFSSLFLAVTAPSTDWQTPAVLANFVTMPFTFASASLVPTAGFPWWMKLISELNPITYSTLLGRAFVLGRSVPWDNLWGMIGFGVICLVVGYFVSARWLRVE
ncbi:MAG TPA: ABC transporter permease [Thermoplasmata archaeon]|nr:ABC transporter permease [Thermoplasmata archaeon]